MRPIYSIALSAVIAATFGGVVACSSGTGEDTDGAGAAASVEGKANQDAALALKGVWKGTGEILAMTLDPSSFESGNGERSVFFSGEQDTKHKPANADDKTEVDRTSLDIQVIQPPSGTKKGILEFRSGTFVDSNTSSKSTSIVETYEYELKGNTLSFVQKKRTSKVTEFIFATSEDKQGPEETLPVRAPFTLTKADSWCAVSDSNGFVQPAKASCSSQFANGTWVPTGGPPECKDREDNCMRCEANACKLVKVSTCELVGNTCAKDIDSCQIQNNTRVGQATTVGPEGEAVSCAGSADGPVCCQRIFGGDEEFGD